MALLVPKFNPSMIEILVLIDSQQSLDQEKVVQLYI